MHLELLKMRLCKFFGVDSLFIPDHYTTGAPASAWSADQTPIAKLIPSADAFFDPFVMLGTMAARFRRVRLGTGVTEPFRRHPATLAQAFVTLDHLTGGRAILGIGNGERENNEPFGIPFRHRVARLDEALSIIRRLWESGGRPIDFDGSIWRLRQARFETPLYNGKPPIVWVAAHAPRMLKVAGRYGDGWYPTLKMSPEEYRGKLMAIGQAAAEAGRPIDGFEAAMQIFLILGRERGATLAQALEVPATGQLLLSIPPAVWNRHGLSHPMGGRYEGYGGGVPGEITPQHLIEARRRATSGLLADTVFAGSLSEVEAEVRALAAAGLRHVVIANIGPMVRGARIDDVMRLAMLIRRLRRIKLTAASAVTD
jgi:phthiodiolone/phenolphthiodiolone dimycocerosates ketoreductase